MVIRTKCVHYSKHFLLNYPELRQELTETLKGQQHDTEESVRYFIFYFNQLIFLKSKFAFFLLVTKLLQQLLPRLRQSFQSFPIGMNSSLSIYTQLSLFVFVCFFTVRISSIFLKGEHWIKS